MTALGILAPVRPCIKCGATERYKDGKCKACKKSRNAAWEAINPGRRKITDAAWYAANSDKKKASRKARYAANPDKHRADAAAWRADHPDRKQAAYAKWRAANADQERVRTAAWRAANPDKQKACDAAWKEANPEIVKIHRQNRRARKKKASGALSTGLAAKLFKLQKGKCPCCNQPLGDDYHLDHKMPLALGGSNTDDNMQLLRKTCNLQKNAKHPIDFMQSRGFLL